MIIAVRKGDLLESNAQTLVNTVNTVGIMGKGIALEFKRAFPDMFAEYVRRCEAGAVRLGEPYLFRRLLPPWIVNFPTKEHWRSVSRLDAIVAGLEYLRSHVEEWGVESLAVPPLGCGYGQLDWDVVGPTLYRHLDALPVPVELYAPFDAAPESVSVEFLARGDVRASTEGRFVPVPLLAVAAILARLEGVRYAWPVGHTRFQKLCYFAQAAGIPLDLEFEERPYGPFAVGLKRVLARLVNNGVVTESTEGRYQRVRPGSTFVDARPRFADGLAEYGDAIERVADLLLRLDPRRTELAATVHFTMTSLVGADGERPSDQKVLAAIRRWKRDKFSEQEVTAAMANLAVLGWLDLSSTRIIDEFDDSAVAFA